MLEIIVPANESFDSKTNTFIYGKEVKLSLEHSLISLSKWESKYQKPFLSSEKTPSEMLDYIRFMTVTPNVPLDTFFRLTPDNVSNIQAYIDSPMTATTISSVNKKPRQQREIITSEILYYYMIALNIPFECQKWHLNRLLVLIEVCSIKNEPPKKMSQKEIVARNRIINEMNRKKFNTKG